MWIGTPSDAVANDVAEIVEQVPSRNKRHIKADWQFTTADARVKRKRLYPANMKDSGY
jgi:hypothetical protein